MKCFISRKAALLCAVIFVTSARATTFNGTPNTTLGGGLEITTFLGVESFVVSQTDFLLDVTFGIQYFNTVATGPLDYFVFADNGQTPTFGSLPSSVITQGTVASISPVFLVNGGSLSESVATVTFNLSSAPLLTPGKYWFGATFPTDSSGVAWIQTAADDVAHQIAAGAPNSSAPNYTWNLDSVQLYLGVDIGVPEPGSGISTAFGLAALAAIIASKHGLRRRFRRSTALRNR